MAFILVIADDLTGAAELGGVALRYNLTAEVVHDLSEKLYTDVCILNTNTRSLKEDQVLPHLHNLFQAIEINNFTFIYLKFDSALRGHIYQEVTFYQQLFGVNRLIFCPGNPVFGRIIDKGMYWVNDKLIHQTAFAHDPEFPIHTSTVLDLLDAASNWQLLSADDEPEKEGVYVAEVKRQKDVQRLASRSADARLAAGGAAFFNELLAQRFPLGLNEQHDSVERVQEPVLFICGSTHENSRQWINQVPSRYVLSWDGVDPNIVYDLATVLNTYGKAVFALHPQVQAEAAVVREKMAEIVAVVQSRQIIKELCIEGGATAYEVLKKLGITVFTPVSELDQGVIRAKVRDGELYLTLKPGSYTWRRDLFKFDTHLNQ